FRLGRIYRAWVGGVVFTGPSQAQFGRFGQLRLRFASVSPPPGRGRPGLREHLEGVLPEETILTDDFLRELINVGEVDILIGVPTYNDAKTVGQVVQAIRAGLLKYFPRQRAVIVNADGGWRDGSQEVVGRASGGTWQP